MAESFSHKFGQIIGDLLESAIQPHLEKFTKKHKLYLDKKGTRITRSGKKLIWTDLKENAHNLDFVLERGGTDQALGVPVAFIETAWRRYAKHSRNKAQEIQGAIIPLSEKYKNSSLFLGVILAGVFTEGAINQLKSLGFSVLHFSYDAVIEVFNKFKIDADFNETTSEISFKSKIKSWEDLPDKEEVGKELLKINKKKVDEFFIALTQSVSRYIESVCILPLYGQISSMPTVIQAIQFLKGYAENNPIVPLSKYEIIIRYNTGDKIEATFNDKKNAIDFLKIYT